MSNNIVIKSFVMYSILFFFGILFSSTVFAAETISDIGFCDGTVDCSVYNGNQLACEDAYRFHCVWDLDASYDPTTPSELTEPGYCYNDGFYDCAVLDGYYDACLSAEPLGCTWNPGCMHDSDCTYYDFRTGGHVLGVCVGEGGTCSGQWKTNTKVWIDGKPFDWEEYMIYTPVTHRDTPSTMTLYDTSTGTETYIVEGGVCDICLHAGNLGYYVSGNSWYKRTCVQNKFIVCFGVRWSDSSTYVGRAYDYDSCDGFTSQDCQVPAHLGCVWNSDYGDCCWATCASAGYPECGGSQIICDQEVDCGSCSNGEQCVNGYCECPYTCESTGKCGVNTFCGVSTNCGGCPSGYSCDPIDKICILESAPVITCNGIALETGEVCDGTLFGGKTCSSETGGTRPCGSLICNSCTSISTANCYATSTFYRDADNDGRGNCTNTVSACTAPSGYISTCSDINDNNINVWQYLPGYRDQDGDSCTIGSSISVPSGATLPTGYRSTQGTTDCNDTNPTLCATCPYCNCYIDIDGDGYGNTSNMIVVPGSTCPTGRTTQSGDINDTDPNVWQYLPGYRDSDGDSCTVGSSISVPSGATLPTGYRSTQGTTDCNDSNPSLCAVCTTVNCYLDSDGDGYGLTTNLITAASCPTGRVTTGGDCNDTNPSIYPGISEVCGNGIDDNCVSGIDEGCAYCGDGSTNQASEDCDWGTSNTNIPCIATYGTTCTYCNTTCKLRMVSGLRCGDGIINSTYEECDDGAANTDTCYVDYNGGYCQYCERDTCDIKIISAPYCGDGIVNGDEECDDGNSIDTDSCRNDCTDSQTSLCTGFIPYYDRTRFYGGESPGYYTAPTGLIDMVCDSSQDVLYIAEVYAAGIHSSAEPVIFENAMAVFGENIIKSSQSFTDVRMLVNQNYYPTCIDRMSMDGFCKSKGYDIAISSAVTSTLGSVSRHNCARWTGTTWYQSIDITPVSITCSYLPVCVNDWGSRIQFCAEKGFYNRADWISSQDTGPCKAYVDGQWVVSEGSTGTIGCYYNIGEGYSQNVAFTLNGESYAYNCSRDGVCVEDYSLDPLCGFSKRDANGLFIDPDCGVHTWQTCGRFQLRDGTIGYDCNPVDNRGYNSHTQCVNPTDCVYYNSSGYNCIPDGERIPVPGTNDGFIVCTAGEMLDGTQVNVFCPEEYQWSTNTLSGISGLCRYPTDRCLSECPQALHFSSSDDYGALCNDYQWYQSDDRITCTGDNCPRLSECEDYEYNYVTNWNCFTNSTEQDKFARYCAPIISYPEYQYHDIFEIETE